MRGGSTPPLSRHIQFCVTSCFRSAVAFNRGALADAVADAEASLAVIESNIPMHTSFFDARARLRLAEGEYEQALHELVARGRHVDAFGVRNPAIFAWRSQAALALLGLGRRDEARRYAAEELALARQWGAPRALGKSLVAAGLAEGGEEGIGLLREAVAVLEPSQARLEHARALVELGSALRRANRRSESREQLRRGLELATGCGAAPLAERAETELLATGARPRRIALSGLESLTPSERRVAELAADGGTNREIAQALFARRRRSRCTSRASTASSSSARAGSLLPPSPTRTHARQCPPTAERTKLPRGAAITCAEVGTTSRPRRRVYSA
jgi:tetratricopeptide (TPR) repeat protein